MIGLLVGTVLATLTLNGQQAMPKNTGIEVLDQNESNNARAVRVATTVFQQQNLDLVHYKSTLVRDGESLVVIFTDKDGRAGGRGNSGTRPGFEVQMDARDLRVIRSNFIR